MLTMKTRSVSAKRVLIFLIVAACAVGAVSCMRSCRNGSRTGLQFVGPSQTKQSSIRAGLVVAVHGWIEKGRGDWPQDMALAIHERVDTNEWCCAYFDWSKQAKTLNPTEAAEHAGNAAGAQLAQEIIKLNSDWRHIHLIGHSCGSWVVSEAAKILASKTNADIHLTFLDAYVPAFWDESSLADVNAADANCWAEHYYTRDYTLGWTQHNLTFAHNVDITSIDFGFKDHNFPWKWYYATISGSYPKGSSWVRHEPANTVEGFEYGFARSRESGGSKQWQISRGLPTGNKAVKLKKQ